MITLSRRVIEAGIGFVHVFFHSPSFTAGLSPYGATKEKVEALDRNVGEFLEWISAFTKVEFATVTQAADAIIPPITKSSFEESNHERPTSNVER